MLEFYIIFPTRYDKIEDAIASRQEIEAFKKDIFMTFDRIDCENNSRIYIDRKNKEDFIDDFNALEKLIQIRIGSYTLEETLMQYIVQNSIRVISANEQEIGFSLMCNSFNEADQICNQNNTERRLNRTDFRHCENHPNHIPSKSPLIGGVNSFDTAEGLLKSAIGDAKTRKTYLINIDKENNNFIIRFEDENFSDQYHAFHLVKHDGSLYKEDKKSIESVKNPGKGIPRAFKLIKYRDEKNSDHAKE